MSLNITDKINATKRELVLKKYLLELNLDILNLMPSNLDERKIIDNVITAANNSADDLNNIMTLNRFILNNIMAVSALKVLRDDRDPLSTIANIKHVSSEKSKGHERVTISTILSDIESSLADRDYNGYMQTIINLCIMTYGNDVFYLIASCVCGVVSYGDMSVMDTQISKEDMIIVMNDSYRFTDKYESFKADMYKNIAWYNEE